ncbi:MAG: hypothetical protein R2710_09595 [Acidimicrobiales bacterium]
MPVLLVPLAAIVAAELLHQRAARTAVAAGTGSTAVVVLGYPTRANGRPHPIQRWRVRLGIRTMRAAAAERIVFTAAPPPTTTSRPRPWRTSLAEPAFRLQPS